MSGPLTSGNDPLHCTSAYSPARGARHTACTSGIPCVFLKIMWKKAVCTLFNTLMLFIVVPSIIIIAVAPKGAEFTLWIKSEAPYNSRVCYVWGNCTRNSSRLWFFESNGGGHRRPLLRDAKEKNGDASFHKCYPVPAELWRLWVLQCWLQDIYYSAIIINRCL